MTPEVTSHARITLNCPKNYYFTAFPYVTWSTSTLIPCYVIVKAIILCDDVYNIMVNYNTIMIMTMAIATAVQRQWWS